MKQTVKSIQAKKKANLPITMLTCYDYTTAKLMDACGVDMMLVGDSLGNVMLGLPDTISVTMEDMIHHSAAVARGAQNAFIVTDMPFLSYQTSVYDAVCNAGRLLKEGRAQAVKLEGGEKMADRIEAIVNASIPVVAHIGMTPQSVNAFGGFKVQGRELAAAKQLIRDAAAVQAAGAFAVTLECVPSELAAYITQMLDIPTIGIGAGSGCDGQVLVCQDMLGMFSDYTPKFVRHFGEIGTQMQEAFRAYIKAVGERSFPSQAEGYQIDPAVMDSIREEDCEDENS